MINDPRLKRNKLGFFEVVNKPTQEELNSYYADKYFQQAEGSIQRTYNEDELRYIGLKNKQRSFLVERLTKKTDGKMLDVGCGEGFTLKHYFDLGWWVRGIDFSKAGLETQNPDMLKYVDIGDIYEKLIRYKKSSRRFDVIYLSNVLEHVVDPITLLNDLKNIISEEGVLVATVPNDGSDLQEYCLSNSLIPDRFWIAPPAHMSYFSYESLQSISNNTGWHCADIISDFPIDLYLLHKGSNYVVQKNNGKPAHQARIATEIILSDRDIVDVIDFYRAMAKVGMGRDLTAFLSPLQKQIKSFIV